MNDLLDEALSQLHRTDIPSPPIGVVQRGARRRQRRRRAVGLTAAAAVAVACLAGIAGGNDDPASLYVTGGPSATTAATVPDVVIDTTEPLSPIPPAGYQAVSAAGGATAGYLAIADLDRAIAVGEPVLDIGTGAYEIRGFRVTDAQGELVGYFLVGDAGFVTLAQVADPADADEYGRQQQAEPLSQEEGRKIMEEIRNRAAD